MMSPLWLGIANTVLYQIAREQRQAIYESQMAMIIKPGVFAGFKCEYCGRRNGSLLHECAGCGAPRK